MSSDKPRSPDQFVMYTHGWIKKFSPLLSEAERRVYDALAVRFGPDRDGLVWMRQSTIAQMAGYSRRQTVGAAIEGLREKGLIDVINWSVVIDRPGGKFQQIGGGKEAGKHNVFMLLHVDEKGYHRAEQARPSVADLFASHREQIDLNNNLVRMLYAGRTFNEIRQFLLDAYPGMETSAYWSDPSPDEQSWPEDFDEHHLMMAAMFSARAALEAKYPDAGRPNMTLVFGNPEYGTVEQNGRELLKVHFEIEAAIGDKWDTVMRESGNIHDHADYPYRRVRDDKEGVWKRFMPTLAALCDQLNVLPDYVVSVARGLAIKNAMVILVMGDNGPIGIDCKEPNAWCSPEVAELAVLSKDEITPEQQSHFQSTITAVKAAQKTLLEQFVIGVWPDQEPDGVGPDQYAGFVSERFNEWATTQWNYTKLLVPLTKTTAAQVHHIHNALLPIQTQPVGA